MEHKITKLGKISPEFDVFKLKSALTKNDQEIGVMSQ